MPGAGKIDRGRSEENRPFRCRSSNAYRAGPDKRNCGHSFYDQLTFATGRASTIRVVK
jgi:hypothetical protein